MRIFAMVMVAVAIMVGWMAGGPQSATSPQAVAAPPEDWRKPHENSGTVTLSRGWNGHFFADGDVEGKALRFVVDTGATSVALGREDARRLGVDIAALAFDGEGRTATSTIRYAHVTLPRLRVGDIQLLNVAASVLDVPETMPLLGQSFLGRLEKVSIEGDRMTLTKE